MVSSERWHRATLAVTPPRAWARWFLLPVFSIGTPRTDVFSLFWYFSGRRITSPRARGSSARACRPVQHDREEVPNEVRPVHVRPQSPPLSRYCIGCGAERL